MPGYKYFGKPSSSVKGKKGLGGVDFLVNEPLIDDIPITKRVKCNETIWLRIRNRSAVDL